MHPMTTITIPASNAVRIFRRRQQRLKKHKRCRRFDRTARVWHVIDRALWAWRVYAELDGDRFTVSRVLELGGGSGGFVTAGACKEGPQ